MLKNIVMHTGTKTCAIISKMFSYCLLLVVPTRLSKGQNLIQGLLERSCDEEGRHNCFRTFCIQEEQPISQYDGLTQLYKFVCENEIEHSRPWQILLSRIHRNSDIYCR